MTENLRNTYSTFVKFLGETLGPDYEIVLHDLDTPDHSVIAIANGHITNRQIGSPLSHAATMALETKAYETTTHLVNFHSIEENGRVLRCSAFFIKNESGVPEGILTIVFNDRKNSVIPPELNALLYHAGNTDNMINSAASAYCQTAAKTRVQSTGLLFSDSSSVTPAATGSNVQEIMKKIYTDVISDKTLPPVDHLNQYEKRSLIKNLDERGFFHMKGAITFIASKLSCSAATVYRYLSEIRNML